MRVTSGQTADEIISNIAPPGKGERQLLVMGGDDSQEEKFLVIHEDEAQALSMIQDVSTERFSIEETLLTVL